MSNHYRGGVYAGCHGSAAQGAQGGAAPGENQAGHPGKTTGGEEHQHGRQAGAQLTAMRHLILWAQLQGHAAALTVTATYAVGRICSGSFWQDQMTHIPPRLPILVCRAIFMGSDSHADRHIHEQTHADKDTDKHIHAYTQADKCTDTETHTHT